MATLFCVCFMLCSTLMMAQASTVCDIPRTCRDVKPDGNKYKVVTMYNEMTMLCEMETDSGGWTVIQKRIKGDVNFNRSWVEIKHEFGHFNGDYWFGLERVSHLTTLGRYELYVSFDFNSKSYFARYSLFKVFPKEDKYALRIGGYSGNAGDSLTYHNEMGFTTYDQDNDISGHRNCAVRYKGPWWHRDCHQSNLNGIWGATAFGEGTNWLATTGHRASASNIRMMIRAY
ncbi:hypothetical protein RRG08_046517 [Elysia crispata]|uniref:Fibrinogen C-terminal domain-containing protein n=1 Tax=Elysia crispata TaxID=231223 RepID=A0AAE0Z729_9GAST|nr:hypothetical protein RRG08_046517 [Elysia crispata]